MSEQRVADDVKELLERAVKSLQLAENLGDVRDAEEVWLYPALQDLGLNPEEMRYPDDE